MQLLRQTFIFAGVSLVNPTKKCVTDIEGLRNLQAMWEDIKTMNTLIKIGGKKHC